MVSREAFNERIKQSAELYSSTIADGVAEKFPDIDPVFIETIRELSMYGFIDGASLILDALERRKLKNNEKEQYF